MDYRKRILIPIDSGDSRIFKTASGLQIANGYTRVVIGKRGPYVEFEDEHICKDSIKHKTPDAEKFAWYYDEYRSIDKSNVKLYFQKKNVYYADYLIGMWYISPFDLYVDNKTIVKPLKPNLFDE